jgi:F420-dependent methylenetetrahydromethanopterin dehydrogenase
LTADNFVFPYSNAKDMRVMQDLNSFGEIIAHAQCSVDEKKEKYIPCVPIFNPKIPRYLPFILL